MRTSLLCLLALFSSLSAQTDCSSHYKDCMHNTHDKQNCMTEYSRCRRGDASPQEVVTPILPPEPIQTPMEPTPPEKPCGCAAISTTPEEDPFTDSPCSRNCDQRASAASENGGDTYKAEWNACLKKCGGPDDPYAPIVPKDCGKPCDKAYYLCLAEDENDTEHCSQSLAQCKKGCLPPAPPTPEPIPVKPICPYCEGKFKQCLKNKNRTYEQCRASLNSCQDACTHNETEGMEP